jgi:hypothetical protein
MYPDGLTWSLVILGSATVFAVLRFIDAVTHRELVHTELSSTELPTHRQILVASFLMEISLVLMYWNPLVMLPFFIAFFITRTAHEFIDELKYHADRCSSYENYLHLGMWVTVLVKTSALFIWGFFGRFKGVEELPVLIWLWGAVVLLVLSWVSIKEWNR